MNLRPVGSRHPLPPLPLPVAGSKAGRSHRGHRPGCPPAAPRGRRYLRTPAGPGDGGRATGAGEGASCPGRAANAAHPAGQADCGAACAARRRGCGRCGTVAVPAVEQTRQRHEYETVCGAREVRLGQAVDGGRRVGDVEQHGAAEQSGFGFGRGRRLDEREVVAHAPSPPSSSGGGSSNVRARRRYAAVSRRRPRRTRCREAC